jgi:coproporphyrinogen III oxidase-like Fe-S oxidoreductase
MRGESVISGAESLTDENRTFEQVYLGLRTRRGLEIAEAEIGRTRAWESAGWAVIDEHQQTSRVQLTSLGWLRLDSLAADLAVNRTRQVGATVGPNPSHCYI